MKSVASEFDDARLGTPEPGVAAFVPVETLMTAEGSELYGEPPRKLHPPVPLPRGFFNAGMAAWKRFSRSAVRAGLFVLLAAAHLATALQAGFFPVSKDDLEDRTITDRRPWNALEEQLGQVDLPQPGRIRRMHSRSN